MNMNTTAKRTGMAQIGDALQLSEKRSCLLLNTVIYTSNSVLPRNNADIWNSCRKSCMKRQPRWLPQGNCSHLSRLAASTAGTIQTPSTCSSESSSLPPSCGHQMVLLAWWGPCRKSVCRRERGWECLVLWSIIFHNRSGPSNSLI